LASLDHSHNLNLPDDGDNDANLYPLKKTKEKLLLLLLMKISMLIGTISAEYRNTNVQND
jgi:hypothetical protein